MSNPEPNPTALDVRILHVADLITAIAAGLNPNWYRITMHDLKEYADDLRDIASELRAAPTPARTTTVDTIIALFAGARSEVDLRETWADVAPSLPALGVSERLRVLEGFNTRMCAVCRDDG